MQLKNKIKIEIIKQGYKSVMSFCDQHDLSYQKINRLIRYEVGSFHIQTIVEICEALNSDVGDLFYLEDGQASQSRH